MKKKNNTLSKNIIIGFIMIIITTLACSRNNEVTTDYNQKVAKHRLDSVMATIPTHIIDNDKYTIKKYKNGRVDTVYKKENEINKKGSRKKSHNGGDSGSGAVGESTEDDFVNNPGPSGIDMTTKIAKSFTGFREGGEFVEILLNAWIVNGSSTKYPPTGPPITRYSIMLNQNHSFLGGLPTSVAQCTWSANIYQRVTVNNISNTATTYWTRSKSYSAMGW